MSSPSPHDITLLDYRTPPRHEQSPSWAHRFALDVAHRAGSLGLFLLLGGVALTVAAKTASASRLAHLLLLGAFACCDAGTLSGLAAWWTKRRDINADTSEARGVILFNLVLLVVAMALLIYRRLHHG